MSKLPINEVGVIVSRLVEHNAQVGQFHSAVAKGGADIILPEPTVLQTLDQAKKSLLAAIKPLVEELIQLDSPFDKEALLALTAQPETFFSPQMARANRCFLKGLIPRERVVREFGAESLTLFNDLTTDLKLNPRPKQDEIFLAFKEDFVSLLEKQTNLSEAKRQGNRQHGRVAYQGNPRKAATIARS